MANLMRFRAKADLGKAGPHILKIRMVDPGLAIDKIMIDTGGLTDSYLGPPESKNFGVRPLRKD
jgi:hypothetical protein